MTLPILHTGEYTVAAPLPLTALAHPVSLPAGHGIVSDGTQFITAPVGGAGGSVALVSQATNGIVNQFGAGTFLTVDALPFARAGREMTDYVGTFGGLTYTVSVTAGTELQPAWRMFNLGSAADSAQFQNTTVVVELLVSEASTPTGYSVRASNDAGAAPRSWTFDAWNGAAWTTLDARTNVSPWAAGETRTYSFANTTEYTRFRLNVTAAYTNVPPAPPPEFFPRAGFYSWVWNSANSYLEQTSGANTWIVRASTSSATAGQAFDGITTNWWLGNSATNEWLAMEFPSTVICTAVRYVLPASLPFQHGMTSMKIQGSATGAAGAWIDVHTVPVQDWNTGGRDRTFPFVNATAYKHWRVIGSTGGFGCVVGEMQWTYQAAAGLPTFSIAEMTITGTNQQIQKPRFLADTATGGQWRNVEFKRAGGNVTGTISDNEFSLTAPPHPTFSVQSVTPSVVGQVLNTFSASRDAQGHASFTPVALPLPSSPVQAIVAGVNTVVTEIPVGSGFFRIDSGVSGGGSAGVLSLTPLTSSLAINNVNGNLNIATVGPTATYTPTITAGVQLSDTELTFANGVLVSARPVFRTIPSGGGGGITGVTLTSTTPTNSVLQNSGFGTSFSLKSIVGTNGITVTDSATTLLISGSGSSGGGATIVGSTNPTALAIVNNLGTATITPNFGGTGSSNLFSHSDHTHSFTQAGGNITGTITGNTFTLTAPTGGGGITGVTLTNVATGFPVLQNNVINGTSATFKTLLAGGGVTINDNGSHLTISSTGGSGSAGVTSLNGLSGVLNLIGTGGINIATTGTTVEISGSGGGSYTHPTFPVQSFGAFLLGSDLNFELPVMNNQGHITGKTAYSFTLPSGGGGGSYTHPTFPVTTFNAAIAGTTLNIDLPTVNSQGHTIGKSSVALALPSGGVSTTIANVGTGIPLSTGTAPNYSLKSIAAGPGINLTEFGGTLTVSSTGGSYTHPTFPVTTFNAAIAGSTLNIDLPTVNSQGHTIGKASVALALPSGGSGVTITNFSTVGQPLIINAGAGPNFFLRGLSAGTGITLATDPASQDIVINNSNSLPVGSHTQTLRYNASNQLVPNNTVRISDDDMLNVGTNTIAQMRNATRSFAFGDNFNTSTQKTFSITFGNVQYFVPPRTHTFYLVGGDISGSIFTTFEVNVETRKIGFFGAIPVSRPSTTNDITSVRNALIALGLIS
jgi:hypothetical protein